MKSVVFMSSMFAAVSGAWASTCSVKHDTAMSLDYYKNVKVSQSDCCDLCANDSRCRTAVYSPWGECHLHDAKDSARAFGKRGWMLMTVAPAPPTPSTKNIVQLAQATPDLSTLVTALVAGGLTGTLSGKGPFTVFAPTNEAFAKIETKALSALLQNKVQLDKVLEYHVLSANLRMRELMAVKIVKTLEGENVDVSDPGGVIKVNNAKVLTADVAATNGFVHIIDTVLMTPSGPPLPLKKEDIVHVAEGNADLSTLVTALTAGKLVATLEGKGPFTVFAPTNEAFAKIPAAALQKLLANPTQLDKVLEYHVLAGKFSMRDLMAVLSVKTLEGENVKVSGSGKVINVNEAKVLKADVEASNGVVHVIDTVLSLPKEDIVHVAEGNADLSTLVTALTAGKLVATLQGKGPFTVFAPTNEAFAKIPAAALQKLLANPTELDKVLEYHVLAGKFSMRDLMAVLSVKTLEGENVKVSGSGKVINVNEAKVLKADVEASNGVVHVIDTVLSLPKDVIV